MTPHIEAEKGEIASKVIMPGDPLRAKFIAENFLEDYKLVNKVRGMFGYTGKYKGSLVTVMASGMGIPSMGIYAYELYKFYDVKEIIRIGSSGSYSEHVYIFDTVLADKSYTSSSFAKTFNGDDCHMIEASSTLNERIIETANRLNQKIVVGNINCSEVFDPYALDKETLLDGLPNDIIAAEMESFALFYLAKRFNRKAACLLTIVDSEYTDQVVTPEERETALKDMIVLALEAIK